MASPLSLRVPSALATDRSMSKFMRVLLIISLATWIPSYHVVVCGFLLPTLSSSRRRRNNRCSLQEIDITQLHVVSRHEEQTYWKLPRLYVGPCQNKQNNHALASGARIPLSPEQSHYLMNVMRIFKKRKNNRKQQQSNGDGGDDVIGGRECIRIFNGLDGEWLAQAHMAQQQPLISGKGRSKKRGNPEVSLEAECIMQLRTQDYNEDERPWLMFVPLKKQPRMKNLIEKCTELGAGKFIPVSSDRMGGDASMAIFGSNSNDSNIDKVYGAQSSSQNDGGSIRFDKLQIQAIEASEQCERLGIPTISNNVFEGSRDTLWMVKDLLKQWRQDFDGENGEGRALLICRERGEYANDGKASVVPVLQALENNKRVSFLVGPEGGWSIEEEALFDEVCSECSGNHSPVQCVSLGTSVLRAKTACMLAIGSWALVST